jgi:hypothetical protein
MYHDGWEIDERDFDPYLLSQDKIVDYVLPNGVHIAQSKGGTKELYDKFNNHIDLVQHVSGHPQLICVNNPNIDFKVLEIANQ